MIQRSDEKSTAAHRRESELALAPLFICLSLPGPVLCKLGQPGVLFVLPEVLTLVLGPLFYFPGLFPSLSSQSLILLAVVQSLSFICLSLAPRTAACQASPSSTISQSWLKFMSVELVMLFNHLILCRSLLLLPSSIFPASGSFPLSWLFASGGQNIGASASA